MNRTTVAEVMRSAVLSVGPDATFTEIADLLHTAAVREVPVIDDHVLVGVISESDVPTLEQADGSWSGHHPLRHRRQPAHQSLGEGTARDVMSTSVVTVTGDVTVGRAARMMRQGRLSWMPVVDADRHVVGVLSRSDLLAVLLRDDRAIREGIVEEVVRPMLAADPARVEVEVAGGVVTLTGETELHADAARLVTLVERVEGVVEVIDRLGYRIDERLADSVVAPSF